MDEKARGRSDVAPEVLERILDVTRRLAAPFELKPLLGEIVEAGRALLRADRGSVFLYEKGSHELVTAVATGVGTLRFSADRGIVGECARTRSVINVPDCYADPRFNTDADRQTGYRTRCLLTVPLIGYDDTLVGVLQLLNKEGGVFDEADERTATALAAQCAVALQRVRMTEQLVIKERMDRELALAREIQTALWPRTMPDLPGYELGARSLLAEQTGGDTFDLIPLPDGRMVVLIADATGHGIGPALSVTQVRSMLRLAVRLGADIDDTFRQLNDQLVHDLPLGRAVTAFLGIVDPRAHTLRYHAGGQAPLLHYVAASGECRWLGSTSIPLGFFELFQPPSAQQVELAPGDLFGLITDGVFEREDDRGETFGTEGVEKLVAAGHAGPLGTLVDSIATQALEFGAPAPQADDITVVLLRRLAPV